MATLATPVPPEALQAGPAKALAAGGATQSGAAAEAVREAGSGGGSSGIDLLLQDHHTFLTLFDRYLKSTSKPEKLRLVDELVRTISLHASAEERFLYPLMLSRLHTSQAHYDREIADDQINRELLHWLETHKPALDAEWPLYDETLLKLSVMLEEHLRQEEATVLAPLRRVLTPQEQAKLHDDLQWAKQHGPTHPHPPAPATRPYANILHPVAGIVDTVTDALKATGIPEKVSEAVGARHMMTPGPSPGAHPATTGRDATPAGSDTPVMAAAGTHPR